MDNETFQSLVFMIFGLGFFLFAVLVVNRDHREAWERRLMEAREFGYKVVHKTAETIPKPRHRKK